MKPGLSPSNKINTLYPQSGVPLLKIKGSLKEVMRSLCISRILQHIAYEMPSSPSATDPKI